MLALVLVVALVAQSVIGAPSGCAEFCDDQSTSGYQTKGSYSSYSKSSYNRLSGSGGLGVTGSRLENLDENLIGSSGIGLGGLERPGTWKDEKHYVTDDGRGAMSYRAGQTVTNNGFSKFAEHSYRYGTHDSHAPLSNSQILTTAEFNGELQNIRNRISAFMGSFNLGSGSVVNANFLQDFKNKANLISSQLNTVCNQVDAGSVMYQQMQQVMQQFQRDVEQRQREMESMIFQSSSSSSVNTATHGSIAHYPSSRPSAQYAPVQQYPVRPTISEEAVVQQRVEEQITNVQSLITSFYTVFNRPDTTQKFQTDLNAQVNAINEKLFELKQESVQNESMRLRIDHLKNQFESYVSTLRNRIQELEKRHQEEEARRIERERQRLAEKQQHEATLRKLEEERIRLLQQEERLKKEQEERDRQIALEQEEERRAREQEERARVQAAQQQLQQQQLQLQQQQQQYQQQQQSHQYQQQQQQHVVAPQVTSTLEVSGSSSYEHSIKGSYGTHGGGSGVTSGSYVHGSHGSYNKPQPVLQPHVDLTAAANRLQQDLNRLQTEINNFNMYSARLTAENSASLVTEAEREAETLRQNINNLCESSARFHNQHVQNSAEELKRRFEEIFRSFQSQAESYNAEASFSGSASYSSESSYGASGSFATVHAPSIKNVQFEHSKSTDVEIEGRPSGANQRLVAGSDYRSRGAYGSQVEDQFKSGVIELGRGSLDCVEQAAGQPCIVNDQRRRYRRHVGGK